MELEQMVPKAKVTRSKRTQNDDLAIYAKKTPRSLKMYREALRTMPGGQSHNARFFEPYPFYAQKSRGKYIWDVDGNRYIDYWMGHTALILGHSPAVIAQRIRTNADKGLLYGAPNQYAFELAELVARIVPSAEAVRFCTTGAEATMYAVRLARAFTKRKTIVKMAGGWHGYSSSLTVGVSTPYETPESAGLVDGDESHVRLAEFNNIEATRQVLIENSADIAGLIVEPVMGSGGVLPARKEYLAFLKEECDKRGIVLIFDEIITGFRLALGGAQEYYGIKPDICTLGKILGGGLPVSAIAGSSEIMSLADVRNKTKTERCWIGGGTFSENAMCMKTGIATLNYLSTNRASIYKRIGALGERIRVSVDKVFNENGVRAETTGIGSLFATHFLAEGQERLQGPGDVAESNRALENRYYFSLIANDNIYFIPGHIGAIAAVHTDSDVKNFINATDSFAESL